METEHIVITSKEDKDGRASLREDELRNIFYHIIGLIARYVSNDKVKEAFEAALKQYS